MTGRIYLLQNNGTLQSLDQQAYESEALLQRLLAEHPDLLAGEQMNQEAPRRWILVAREAGVPGELDGATRWSVDHLFLDQDGIPTLVEVKRSSDARIRREVVGQMLDYAANAVVYWPVESIRARLDVTCGAAREDPAQVVADLIGATPEDTAALDDFWRRVADNLHIGRVRLVFVADEIPPGLRRVVEFLNEQMAQAEVLAVEINQFVGEGLKTLVPRVMGQTAEAEQAKKGPRPLRQWNEPMFFDELSSRVAPEEVRAARELFAWAARSATRVFWGRGERDASFAPVLTHNGFKYQPFAVYTYGRLEVHFQYLADRPPFDSELKRRELLDRLNAIPGVSIPADVITRRPSIPLSVLADPAALEPFLRTFDWVLDEIRAS